MTRKSWQEIRDNHSRGAMKGWDTRRANEASRARRFDEVLAENRHMKGYLQKIVDLCEGDEDRIAVKVFAKLALASPRK